MYFDQDFYKKNNLLLLIPERRKQKKKCLRIIKLFFYKLSNIEQKISIFYASKSITFNITKFNDVLSWAINFNLNVHHFKCF